MTDEWNYANVDLSGGDNTAVSYPALVKSVYVNSDLSAHACPIKDGSNSVITLKASLSAGSNIDLFGIQYNEHVLVNPDASATGDITILFKRLRF